MRIYLLFGLLVLSTIAIKPVAIFHGFGDACVNGGMKSFAKLIADTSGVEAKCVETGWIGTTASFFKDFGDQGKYACKQIKKNKLFKNGFSVLGISQGGLIARYVVENCPGAEPVRHMITFGAPHAGTAAVPGCNEGGWFCGFMNFMAKKLAYFWLSQHFVAPASYFRDPANLKDFYKHSHFLPALNNDLESAQNKLHKERIEALETAFLGWFNEDTMIYPAETAIFGQLQTDGSVTPLNETSYYETLGFKTLKEQGKLIEHEFDGDHLHFTKQEVADLVAPILSS